MTKEKPYKIRKFLKHFSSGWTINTHGYPTYDESFAIRLCFA